MFNNTQVDQMVDGYLEAAEWADKPEGSRARFTNAAKQKARVDCLAFLEAVGILADKAIEQPGYHTRQFGQDFWLTRCGHGVGYWDRDELKIETGNNITFFDRDKHTLCTDPADNLGNSLTAIAFGEDRISPFAYASLSAYRGWLNFD